MAKKRKTKRRRKPTHVMAVIRVSVPIELYPKMRIYKVWGDPRERNTPLCDLEILNAYYDYQKQPAAA